VTGLYGHRFHLLTPPSEPAVQVSLQRALHPLVNLSQMAE
jgi:hypothetical protein